MNSALLRAVCVAEAATGLGLLVQPSTVVRMLLGSELLGAGVFTSRIAGIALMALGVACWPGGARSGLLGMTLYSAVAAAYMAVLGWTGAPTGILWWPALAAHGALAILLTWALFEK